MTALLCFPDAKCNGATFSDEPLSEVSEQNDQTSLQLGNAGERIVVVRDPRLPGVEIKTITNAQQLWRVFHERYALVSTLTGASTRTFRGRSIVRRAGELMLYEPGDFDTNTHFEPETSFLVLTIEPRLLRETLSEAADRHDWSFVRANVSANTLAAALRNLTTAMQAPHSDGCPEIVFAALIDELACHHLRDASISRLKAAASHERDMASVCERLHNDLHAALRLDDLARETKLDKYQLLRRFKAYCGTTPSAYRQALRVARARTMLRRDRKPSEVGALLGFADFSHFRRTFVKYAGMSPNQYRRALAR